MPKKLLAFTPCGYCFSAWATEYDHMIPKSYGGKNKLTNLHPTCSTCNNIAGNQIFDSIETKRKYIQKQRLFKRIDKQKPKRSRKKVDKIQRLIEKLQKKIDDLNI